MNLPGRTASGAGGSAGPRSVSLHHPSRPYLGDASNAQLAADLRGLANQYLESVQASTGISGAVLTALSSTRRPPPYFAWLPLSWGTGAQEAKPDPLGSFWVSRELPGGKRVDHSVVLLAGYRLTDDRPAGGEVGLRVVMHLAPAPNGSDWKVRITGMSASRLPQGFGSAPTLAADHSRLDGRLSSLVAALGGGRHVLDGIAYLDPAKDHGERVFLSCAKPGPDGRGSRNYRIVADLSADGSAARLQHVAERTAHAAPPPTAFAIDAASAAPAAQTEARRTTRAAGKLDPRRRPTRRIPPLLQRGQELQVRQTALGQVSGNPDQVEQIDLAKLPLRSDDLAAAHAYLRGDELMRRLEAYGLTPAQYFKHAALPLLLRHRAPLKGARDGIAINAQVRPVDVGPGIDSRNANQPPPPLDVSFGWAELAHRSRQQNREGRLREQPMGLAADPRWAWHEFGHVLNYASFGELEFRFAHSAGDALAAIVTDPEAHRKGEPADRFRTFPWVFIPRRHDRDALRGWCWCGRRNLARLSQPGASSSRLPRLGYFEEQLLSTSLFRLYRCIGGDDTHLDLRRSASDYCVYLVMRAIQLLGSGPVVPASSVEDFVAALIDADIATGAWHIDATWPEPPASAPASRPVDRVGGCVHKVIRWAFEQQGLYARVAEHEVFEGRGAPPEVDLYIRDRRPGEAGGYAPVPLKVGGGQTPLWHSDDRGVEWRPPHVVVHVHNRGDRPATNVKLRCWVQAQGGTHPWIRLADPTGPSTVPPGSTAPTDFSFAQVDANGAPLMLSGDHLVKAEVSCTEDPSNIDASTGLPPSYIDVDPLFHLVANDNNLALRGLRFP